MLFALEKEKRLSGFYRWRAVRTQNRIGHLPGDYGNDAGSKYVYKIGSLRLLHKTYNACFYKYRYSCRTDTSDTQTPDQKHSFLLHRHTQINHTPDTTLCCSHQMLLQLQNRQTYEHESKHHKKRALQQTAILSSFQYSMIAIF